MSIYPLQARRTDISRRGRRRLKSCWLLRRLRHSRQLRRLQWSGRLVHRIHSALSGFAASKSVCGCAACVKRSRQLRRLQRSRGLRRHCSTLSGCAASNDRGGCAASATLSAAAPTRRAGEREVTFIQRCGFLSHIFRVLFTLSKLCGHAAAGGLPKRGGFFSSEASPSPRLSRQTRGGKNLFTPHSSFGCTTLPKSQRRRGAHTHTIVHSTLAVCRVIQNKRKIIELFIKCIGSTR